MLSIRRPRAPRRLKYILIEVLVITLGLLLALAIDNLAEWHQHRQTVGEARAALRTEITTNVARIDDVLREIETELKRTVASLEALKAFQNARDPQDASKLALNNPELGLTLLRETAWRTAQSTGALSYMSYEEARGYNSIYSVQAEFHRDQRALIEDGVQFLSVARKVDRADNRLSATDASELARCFGLLEGHLQVLRASAGGLSKLLHAFLEGRPVTTVPTDEEQK